MSETPFIKFFPGDFLGGTSGLTPAERGVYITLLCLMWEGEGPITMDEGRLARRCGMPKAAFKKALAALIDEEKIVRTGRGLTNTRAEKTLMDRQNRIENATHAASRRWSAQEEKNQQNQGHKNADALPEQCATDAKPEARSQSIKEGGGGSAGARDAENPDQKTDRELILEAVGVGPDGVAGPSKFIGGQADMAEVRRWLELPGLSVELVCEEIRRVMATKVDGPPSSFKYFTGAMQRLSGQITSPPLQMVAGGGARASPQRIAIDFASYSEKYDDHGNPK